MMRARKLGVHTPGTAPMPCGGVCGSCGWHARSAWQPPRLRCRDPTAPSYVALETELPLARTAVLYQVDHATACIYMERIEGHSLKTLLHNDELQGAGEAWEWLSPTRLLHARATAAGSGGACRQAWRRGLAERMTAGKWGAALEATRSVVAGRTLTCLQSAPLVPNPAHPSICSPSLTHPPPTHPPELDALLLEVGRVIARLHDGGLVHGDLTTSNMMLRGSDKQLVGGRGACSACRAKSGVSCRTACCLPRLSAR